MDNFVEMLKSIGTWILTEGLKAIIGLVVLFILFKITNFFTKR